MTESSKDSKIMSGATSGARNPFGEKAEEHAKALYEALSGNKVYTAKKCRLEDVFFGQMRNDVSYEFDDKIVCFVEHQSTINHNMPFRLLMYVGRVYEMLTNMDKTKKFRKKTV